MRVLETRGVAPGMKRRRYQADDGSRLTTFEVPATVLNAFGKTAVRVALAKWQRGEARRALARQRKAHILAALARGEKPLAIAAELGVSEQRVRQFRTERGR